MHLTRIGTLVRLNASAIQTFTGSSKEPWLGKLGEFLGRPYPIAIPHLARIWWPELNIVDAWDQHWLEPFNPNENE